jgi:hypothetical protein
MSVPAATPRFTRGQIRLGLAVIWMAAAATAGIGIGRLIVAGQHSTTTVEAPVPMAVAHVRVMPVAPAIIGRSLPVSQPNLVVVPSSDAAQAQAGMPFQPVGATAYQAADRTLQPGFTAFGSLQGSVGTAPVR